jgi:phosphohistidine phosphatase SixA
VKRIVSPGLVTGPLVAALLIGALAAEAGAAGTSGADSAAAATRPDSAGADSVARPDSAAGAAKTPPAAAKRYPAEVVSPPDSTLVAWLRAGNLVLLFRHAATDWGQRDADVLNFTDRAAQRNLSAIGRAQSDSIGKAVKALGLKIGAVHSSPMFRCRDTAEIAFGRADTTRHLFVKSKESRAVRVAWLSQPITDGSLLVLVTHQDPYIPLFRFQRDQLKEGDALLVRPVGKEQWKLVAQITPADWARLALHFGK